MLARFSLLLLLLKCMHLWKETLNKWKNPETFRNLFGRCLKDGNSRNKLESPSNRKEISRCDYSFSRVKVSKFFFCVCVCVCPGFQQVSFISGKGSGFPKGCITILS